MRLKNYQLEAAIIEKTPRVIEGSGFVDTLTIHQDPTQRGLRMVIRRAYDEAVVGIRKLEEKLDLEEGAPWVRLKKAMQGMKV